MITTTTKKSDFNLDPHLIALIQDAPFFAALSRRISKVAIPSKTAAVSYDIKHDQLTMFYNPTWFSTLTNEEIRGVLVHEFYHIVFGHVTSRSKTPQYLANIAMDLAINSIIDASLNSKEGSTSMRARLPSCGLIPGKLSTKIDGTPFTPEEIASNKLIQFVLKMPPMMPAEWYFKKILEENIDEESAAEGSFDEHGWDEIPEDVKTQVEERIRNIVETAVKEADGTARGWGDVPVSIQKAIRDSLSRKINWNSVLRQFIGTITRGSRKSSIKVINRRFPYLYPGKKRGYVAKLLIARDQSGSVNDEMTSVFFSELTHLTKKVEVDIIDFDTQCDVNEVFKWKKGTIPRRAMVRTRHGGTDFNAPTEMFNDPKNRGRWDGLLIVTDGLAPMPKACRGKRAWILGAGCRLEFSTKELCIIIDQNMKKSGEPSW